MIEIICAGIGWLCLYLWHRDRKKIKKVLQEKYGGDYSAAGMIMVLNLIAGVGALAMFGLMISLLVR